MIGRFVAAVALLGLLAGAVNQVLIHRASWAIERTETPASSAALPDGARVWVHGYAEPVGRALAAPLISGRPCLLYSLEARHASTGPHDPGRVEVLRARATPMWLASEGGTKAWVELLPDAIVQTDGEHQHSVSRKTAGREIKQVATWVPFPVEGGDRRELELDATIASTSSAGKPLTVLRVHSVRPWGGTPGLPNSRLIVVGAVALSGVFLGLLGLLAAEPLFNLLRPGADYGYRLAETGPDDGAEPTKHSPIGIVAAIFFVPACLPVAALLAGIDHWTGLRIVDLDELHGVLSVPAFFILLGACYDLFALFVTRRDPPEEPKPFTRQFWLGAVPVVLLTTGAALLVFQGVIPVDDAAQFRGYRGLVGFGWAAGGLILAIVVGAITSAVLGTGDAEGGA